MPTIRKLPSGTYNVQVRREGHPPLSATFTNTTEAKSLGTPEATSTKAITTAIRECARWPMPWTHSRR